MTSDPIYAVGDIHGQRAFLDAALDRIERDGGPDATVVFVGDLVDRGPDSPGVIDRLREGVAAGHPWTVLCGNHDRMFQTFLRRGHLHNDNIKSGRIWLDERLGGLATLAAYGVEGLGRRSSDQILEDARQRVPASHLKFLDSLPLSHQTEDCFFVHAGIRPGVPLDGQAEDDMLWIRDEFLSDRRRHPKLIVHGHTPVDEPTHYGNRINTDCGAGYDRPLEPVVIEAPDRAFRLTPKGRVRL